MTLSLAYHDSRRSGMMIYIINNQGSAVAQLLMTLPSLLQSLIMLIGMLVVLWMMHWSLAAVSFIVIPILFFASRYYATKMRERIGRTKELEGESLSVIHEAMAMMRVIVAFCRQKLEHRRYMDAAQKSMNARLGVTLRQTFFSLVVSLSTGIGRAAAWAFGGLLALAGKLTIGDLTIVLSYLQDPILFSMTIRDNIRYGRLDAAEEEIYEAARAANAHDFISCLPDGYDTMLGERGSRFSGGERQRVCVARAFLRNSPILILDEPTSSIDSKTEAVILDSLDRLMEGRTTFMIAHRLSRNLDRDVR